MGKEILSKNQHLFLDALKKEKKLCDNFYLTGGTALAAFYLNHRLSEDLDFFSEKEIDKLSISVFLKTIRERLKIKTIDYQESFNRNLFFLHLISKEILKTEFTYFPFPRIEKSVREGNLQIDSILDIAANKLFTIYQNPRSRDFIDLYLILEERKFNLDDLIKKARIKFDWHIDPIQLGTQFKKCQETADFPIMIKKIKPREWQEFFIKEAKKMKKDIFK